MTQDERERLDRLNRAVYDDENNFLGIDGDQVKRLREALHAMIAKHGNDDGECSFCSNAREALKECE